MSSRKKITTLARQLFKLSLEDGRLSPGKVNGVLAWVEKHRPAGTTAVLKAYKRLVEAEIERNQAVIEFAGDVSPAIFQQIAQAMSRRYKRAVEAVPQANPGLVAGVRVRVGCDIFENNVMSQLAALNPTH